MLCMDKERHADARAHLEAMLMDIAASPRAIANRQQFWKSKANQMLSKLPK
jgi:hypothetical protein